MSLMRRLVFLFVSRETARKMQAESERWLLTCPNCQHQVSVWELGGLRYKAKGEPRHYRRCSRCGKAGWFPLTYKA